MQFSETPLQGAFVIEIKPNNDDRGFFARAYCAKEFEAHGLKPEVCQSNLSFNHKKGTLRGMHYQLPPAAETKLVRCVQGSIYDVIIDLRPNSPTFKHQFGIELSAENRRALYVPEMFAHGYQTLTDGAEVLYQVGEFYTPGCEQGLRYDDPSFDIEWPIEVTVLSEKDGTWPLFAEQAQGVK
jgi:dTDP-4-dehydrorhamnose 3,5-epimerase